MIDVVKVRQLISQCRGLSDDLARFCTYEDWIKLRECLNSIEKEIMVDSKPLPKLFSKNTI